MKNCFDCEYENYNECLLTNRRVESIGVPPWCPNKRGRAFAMIDAIKRLSRNKKIETVLGAIIWGLIWFLLGAIIANELCGKVWR